MTFATTELFLTGIITCACIALIIIIVYALFKQQQDKKHDNHDSMILLIIALPIVILCTIFFIRQLRTAYINTRVKNKYTTLKRSIRKNNRKRIEKYLKE